MSDGPSEVLVADGPVKSDGKTVTVTANWTVTISCSTVVRKVGAILEKAMGPSTADVCMKCKHIVDAAVGFLTRIRVLSYSCLSLFAS